MQESKERTIRLIDTGALLVQKRDARLDPIVRFVNAHPEQRLTLDRAAEMAGLERTYFSKFFHAVAGCTFSAWNRSIRMKMASRLLRGPRKSVRAIALAVGYRDLTTFARAFRACIGVSPTTYRKLRYGRPRLQDDVRDPGHQETPKKGNN